MSSDRSSLAYRPCAGAVLINRAGLVFAGRRAGLPADDATAWQMPQGGIDAGEQPLQAAYRETATGGLAQLWRRDIERRLRKP